MAKQTLQPRDWRRKHDPHDEIAAQGITAICVNDATSIIEVLSGPGPGSMKAAGSHWSLSDSTLSDGTYLETNWPHGDPGAPRLSGLDIDMNELISDAARQFMLDSPPRRPEQLTADPCLARDSLFCVHLKAGTKVYEAYSLLDRSQEVVTVLAVDLNGRLVGTDHAGAYDGPWAFETLGGAGGQTVFGALTTGTHGGDHAQKPISDSVLALHLVTEGGAHFWIEPASVRGYVQNGQPFSLTDDDKLRQYYENLVPGVPFKIVRDDEIFDAVTVSVGRFGVVSSVVLRVVPQYCLHEHRRLSLWSLIKPQLLGPARHHAFDGVFFAGTQVEIANDVQSFSQRFGPPAALQGRFLQISFNIAPIHGSDYRCGVTQRWFHPMSGPEAFDPAGELRGRPERGTFARAGLSGPYHPPTDPTKGSEGADILNRACTDADFIAGLLRALADELEKIVSDNKVPAAGAALLALGAGAGAAIAAAVAAAGGLCPALAALAVAYKLLADAIEGPGDRTLAETVGDATKLVTENPLIPDPIKLAIMRSVFDLIFRSEESNRDYVAASYAVMDTHDYIDRSCRVSALSLEVFFDAANPSLYCAYIDAVLAFEAWQQEQKMRFTIGYISARFVRGSDALIAPARFPETVVLEVAALRGIEGSEHFVRNAERLAQNPFFNATFHWGQQNPATRAQVEQQFGDRLFRWRNALAVLNGNGQAFSSAFTRQTGLEPN